MNIQILEIIFKLDKEQAKRMMRGGSWNDRGGNSRSAERDHIEPDDRDRNGGFRLVREV